MPNGCGVTLHFRVNGGGWQTAASSWSDTVGNGYNQIYSIDAYSTDNCGLTSPTSSDSGSTVFYAYNNYGSANAGHAMCRGNPGRPESMPGGTVSQTFTVPSGMANISSVTVQIDPASEVTATATLTVGGSSRTTSAVASGDVTFNFGNVPVSAGQRGSLSIRFSATDGKIITVYSAGSPGGTLSISNSCPDGAPSLATSSTGLRATIQGNG